ncbi:MAG: homoserine dehydrogenase [Clostridia bacterium]
MRKIGVAILGLGTVGSGTYEILTKNRERMKQVYSYDVEVVAVMDKSEERLMALQIPEEKVAKSIMEIALNPEIDIVVEVIGGIGVAKEFVITCLEGGKTVVTANKEMIAKNFKQLHRLAKDNNAGLYYEATCVGGTPVIRTLIDSMQGNDIESLMGIVNGTTNYILTKMSDEGLSYEDALKEAQRLGFAEFDPSADVEGFDASYKLSILSSLAFNGEVSTDNIFREGISTIQKEDINYGKELGYTLKLLAIGKKTEKGIEARVHPTFIKNGNPLASVKGSFNALKIVGDAVGDIMLYGRGAGSLPTGSAIVSDILYASKFLDYGHYYPTETKAYKHNVFNFTNDFECSYYIRMLVEDKTGVLAIVGQLLAENDVSITEVIQKGEAPDGLIPIIITTHKTSESKIQNTLTNAKNYSQINKIVSVIRIEK